MENRAKAVEELKGREDAALHEQTSHNSRGRPPPRADRHLEKPLFERELTCEGIVAAWASAEDGVHGEKVWMS